MDLSEGSQIGLYRIGPPLGAGGMGIVYRARDTRLGRDVAIKVLPAEVAEVPERLARFRREAQLLAALNHPNIAAIHGLEEHAGRPFLVLELVEGEDLSERLKRGPIPLDEAIAVARQVAEALEEAHAKGIVHRDLKPGNVMVRDDGTVKVLDYGLGKLAETDSDAPGGGCSLSPTMSRQATASGVLLGTASYMSPEQAKGKSVDKRADIWAFGCVLFEMLSGRKVFSGETISETLAEILKGEPGWAHLPATVPPAIRNLIERCLTKDPKHRLRDIGDAWPALKDAPEASPQAVPTKRPLGVIVAAFVLGSLLTALVAAFLARPDAASPAPTRRFTLRLRETPEAFHGLGLSPDGARLAYVARIESARKLLVRDLSGTADRVLEGTEDAAFPFFSPDGEWIGFLTLPETAAGADRFGTLKKVSVEGGAPVTLQEKVLAAVWPNADTIVYQSESEKLYRIPSVGGMPEPLEVDLASGGDGPWLLSDLSSDGEALLAVSDPGWRAVVHPMGGGKPRIAVDAGALFARFAPTGHIVYEGGGKLSALPFDSESLETAGAGVPLAGGARPRDWGFSSDGTLVYRIEPKTRLVWVTRSGEEEPLPMEAAHYLAVRLSPDGARIALSYHSVDNPDIWIYDIDRGTTARLTLDPGNDWFPLWGPDGRNVFFVSSRVGKTGLLSKASDGSGAKELLLTNPYYRWPYSWSRDGDELVLEEDHPDTGSDIVILSMDGTGAVTGVIRDPFDQTNPQVSPDGSLIAYESNESGRIEIYVQRFPEPGEKRQISIRGGTEPLWGRDSRELLLREGESVLSVPIATDPLLKTGEPRVLFRGDFVLRDLRAYDYDRHSDRFLMMKLDESETDPKELHVVVHWFEELKRLAPPP